MYSVVLEKTIKSMLWTKKNTNFLDKKSTWKGTVRKKLNIISKNFYFIFLWEQFLLNNFNCDKYFNHLKSKRIPPPINLLLGKQSSNSTIFALKISLNRYKKQRRKQLTGTIEVPFDPNQRPNTLTSVTYLLVGFSSTSVR